MFFGYAKCDWAEFQFQPWIEDAQGEIVDGGLSQVGKSQAAQLFESRARMRIPVAGSLTSGGAQRRCSREYPATAIREGCPRVTRCDYCCAALPSETNSTQRDLATRLRYASSVVGRLRLRGELLNFTLHHDSNVCRQEHCVKRIMGYQQQAYPKLLARAQDQAATRLAKVGVNLAEGFIQSNSCGLRTMHRARATR